MEGMGIKGVLGVESPDPTLSMLSGLGLALSAGTALLVDLVGDLRTGRALGEIAEEGPSLAELSPGRRGVALVSGSGVDEDRAASLIEAFSQHWPAVVVRCHRGQWPWPVVPVRPLLPGLLMPVDPIPAVWQPARTRMKPPGPGPVLPALSARVVRDLLRGRVPLRSRWVGAWERVWEMPWA